MERIYVFIIRNDVWMLILASMGLIWYISEYIRARRLLKRAVFGLEREKGVQYRNNALIFILALTSVVALVFYVNYQIAPTLPPGVLRDPTATPDLIRTPLSSPTPLATIPPTATPPIAPTITLSGQPGVPPAPTSEAPLTTQDTITNSSPLATPPAQPTPDIGCTLQLSISEPRPGAVVSGPIEFFGTADTPDFNGYKMEANGPQTNGQWASLLGRTINQPVVESLLGSVNLSQWESGPYLIRITTLDSAGNEAYQCAIQITLEN